VQDWSGRVAVVTGAASGIGTGLAHAFAQHGMKLLLADIESLPLENLCETLRHAGHEALAVPTDVSRADALETLAERAYAAFGAVNVLCNNAGVCQGGPIHEMSEADWEWILGVNLRGVIHGCRAFVPRMATQGAPAHIVNTASIGGFISGGELGMYSTTKYAVVGYSEALAQDVARHGIGVSILCPGWTNTNLASAARNRPGELGMAPPRMEAIASGMAAGMDPFEVGRRTLRGIRDGDLYIFTHDDLKPVVEHRFRAILEALDRASEPLDEAEDQSR
jgi:NAD(P)-dependent dehydrogenase (short-subunit alcohol dehydrogenase family)